MNRGFCLALSMSVAAALLAACGGSQSPIGVAGKSWMLAEAKNDTQLLYVTDEGSNEVSVVQLPKGKLLGNLTGFEGPSGECTDSDGDVFIVDAQAAQIWEYAHGANSPKNILQDPTYIPLGCSVDPVTGNLAVTNEVGFSGSGNIAIYPNASDKPKYYSFSAITEFGYCTYDDQGDLFAGGSSTGANSSFVELPKGKSTFEELTLNAKISGFSPMRWDGQDLAMLDGVPGSLIYRFKFSGSTGTVVGLLRLKGGNEFGDFTLQGTTIYAPLYDKSEVKSYPYPHGGKVLKTFYGFGVPGGTAISTLPNQK